MSEVEKIKQRYAERKRRALSGQRDSNPVMIANMVGEREHIYSRILKNNFPDPSRLSLMEIGAGGGGNIPFFLASGVKAERLFANELLDDRVEVLRQRYPFINIIAGNALEMDFPQEFDVVFQSTVFTSILDYEFRQQLALKMWEMLKKNGMILWYDFVYSNPKNKDVRKVTRKEVRSLFPHARSIRFYPVTLAPPIARRTGHLYKMVNLVFPFLRTHVVAEIHK